MRLATLALHGSGAADIPQIKSLRPLKAVNDNDEVFGRAPGHLCVFDPAGSLLILGDAMNNVGSKLDGPNPQYTTDMDESMTPWLPRRK
jgi:hypothetical protein